MATSGQTLNDRINAARYALAGQGLARCVCKATTEEVIGPKKKHLDYLLHCTHEPNVSIPQLANLLIERTNHIYWVVVFKALVTVHHLMSYGNERFIQYLASSNYSFELSTFLDKTAARDFSMSTFIRRYSRYINEKALSYRLLAFDFCKIKRGNEGVLRLMPIDRLLKTLPVLQNQLDTLLEFDCSANDLNNGVINACFMLLFRDLIGLFACHNDGIINLLNKYFTLNRKMCREAFDLYKKFLVRMDKVSDFLRVAEVVGIDKDEIPDLRRAPSSLIDALEAHLQNIESNKKILKNQQPSTSSTGKSSNTGELPAFGSLTSPTTTRRPSSPNSATSTNSQNDEFSLNSFKDEEVRKALEEEARVLSQYGTEGLTKSGKSASNKNNSAAGGLSLDADSPKFAVTTIPKSIDDLFGDADSFTSSNNNNNISNNNNNGLSQFDNNNAFDNPNNSTAGSSPNTAAKHSRPDLDSIRSAIKSATTTLEKQQSTTGGSGKTELGKSTNPKKASDDLFSLLDTTVASVETNPKPPYSSSQHGIDLVANSKPAAVSTLAQQLSSTSPFAAGPPFNVHPIQPNGQQLPPLKPGNPFPDVNSAFGGPSMPFATLNPTKAQSSVGNSVFTSATPTANYTNLGGLEGFGDLLQPMSASNKGSSQAAYSANNKPSFSTNSGLPSTGLFKGDLDSTLANLAQNLTFDGITKTKK